MAAKAPRSRTPLARMVRIHQSLMGNRFPNCSSLAGEMEVSTKTVQRDLDYMRDQLGLPIEYDSANHGFVYTEAVTHFPTIPATEGEVLALFVARKALQQYRGTPFEQPLADAFAKLSGALGDTVSVDLDEISRALSFRHTGAAVTDMETFRTVTRATMESRELSFSYTGLRDRRGRVRRVQPLHVAGIDGQWYLFAHDLDRDDIRTFVLSRINGDCETGPVFEQTNDFSLGDRLLGSFGVFTGEGDYTVRIEFDAFAAQLVRERTWHPTQKVKELANGRLRLTLKLDSLEEIERWIFSWGNHARVLQPADLKERVRRTLAAMQEQYREMPPWFADLHEAARFDQPERLLQLVMSLDRKRDAPGQMQLFRG